MNVTDRDGRRLRLTFRYEREPNGRVTTTARLRVLSPQARLHRKGPPPSSVEFLGYAVCMPKDPYVKDQGRSLALSRALAEYAVMTDHNCALDVLTAWHTRSRKEPAPVSYPTPASVTEHVYPVPPAPVQIKVTTPAYF